jgi:hypothetical protein
VVGGEELPVGQLDQQGAVEALDLAVLPGTMGFGEDLLDPVVVLADLPRDHLWASVVGHQPLDLGDGVGSEVGQRTFQKRCAGRALLTGQNLE